MPARQTTYLLDIDQLMTKWEHEPMTRDERIAALRQLEQQARLSREALETK
jgi:hypothetical protein